MSPVHRRVVLLDHTGLVGGAEHSMLTLLEHAEGIVDYRVMCPAGPLSARIPPERRLPPIPAIDATFRLHPVQTPPALARMARAAVLVRRTTSRMRAELIHANSVRAGLVALAARRLGGPPVVVHARDRLPETRLGSAIRRLVERDADGVIAVSSWIAEQYPRAALVERIDNPVDLERFAPSEAARSEVRAELGIGEDDSVIGVVAQITPWKGQEEAIRALTDLAAPAHLLLVGEAKFVAASTTNDNSAYLTSLHALVNDLDLTERVHFLGERPDVPRLMQALDVLAAPSWGEPFGRSVAEALATGVPVVATNVGGPADFVEPGRTGLLVPPNDPAALAAAIADVIDGSALAPDVSEHARATATSRFAPDRHVARVAGVYDAILLAR